MPKQTPTPTILIVDDNRDAVDIIARLLTQHHFSTLRAYSGQECLDLVRSRPVDVIVLDVIMPGMDGLEVCRHLKQAAPTPPIILLTAKDDMATRSAGMSLGVSEFIVKPVNNRDLIARIKTLLWIRDLERDSPPDLPPAPAAPNDKPPRPNNGPPLVAAALIDPDEFTPNAHPWADLRVLDRTK